MESNSGFKPQARRTCLCSPTTHPGSFRCSLHKNSKRSQTRSMRRDGPSSSRSNNWVLRAFLVQMIKPSSHDLQRRRNFKPRPTRFCSSG